MRQLLFCVKDLKAGAFTFPVYGAVSRGVGIRMFQSALNHQEGEMQKYPADYELWELGEFNQENGTLTSAPVPLGLASSYLETRS